MNFDEKIWDYLHGKLTNKEFQRFETEMTKNETLRKEVKILKEIQLSEKLYGRGGVEEQLQAIQLEDENRRKNKRRLWIAAIIIVLISAVVFIWLKPERSSKVAKTYATNATAYPMSLTDNIAEELKRDKYTEGFSPEDTAMINILLDTMNVGIHLYETENYEAALDVFMFYKEKEKDPRIDFLIGKIHLLKGDYAAAIAILEPIDTEQSFIEKVKLHLAVAYILNDENETATKILNQLKRRESDTIDVTVIEALLETL